MYIDFFLGFDSKLVFVMGFEEYWLYRFKVIVVIGNGNLILDFLSIFRIKLGCKWYVREIYLYMYILY